MGLYKRGKVYCKRSSCSEGIDTRMLEKVVIRARAPYYHEKLKALLGGKKKSIDNFLTALAATLSRSPRAPAEISRCATELGIAPIQLRDVIEQLVSVQRAATCYGVVLREQGPLRFEVDEEATRELRREKIAEWENRTSD